MGTRFHAVRHTRSGASMHAYVSCPTSSFLQLRPSGEQWLSWRGSAVQGKAISLTRRSRVGSLCPDQRSVSRRVRVLAAKTEAPIRQQQKHQPANPSKPLGPPQHPESRFLSTRMPRALDIHMLLHNPATDAFLVLLILGTCLGFALQTLDLPVFLRNVVVAYDRVMNVVFVSEYILRWYTTGFNVRFLLTRGMLIDFFAVLLPLAFAAAPIGGDDQQVTTVFVRALRFARIFRLQRVISEDEMRILFKDIPESRLRLANVALTVFTILYVSAGLFYDCEHRWNPAISNMFDSLYFSVICVFTVGFGDVVPVTPAGRAVAAFTVLSSAVLIPLQLSEIVAATMQGPKDPGFREKQQRPGLVDESEAPSPRQESVLTELNSDAGDGAASLGSKGGLALTPVDYNIECPQCRLRGHQRDARYCRNCGAPLGPNGSTSP